METTEEQRSGPAQATVASPKESPIEVPEKELQQQFEEQQSQAKQQGQDTLETAQAPLHEDAQASEDHTADQQDSSATKAQGVVSAGSSRGGATAGRGRGRGGARVTSTASGKGSRGGKGAGGRGRGTARGGAKGGRGGAAAAKGGRGSKAGKGSIGGGGEGSGSGNTAEGSGNTIGSGPSNTIFPLARVSRIVKVDKEIEMTSKDAIWTIAVATELFIKHLTDSAYAKARLDKKKTVTLKELASAVESQNEFFFLQDIIPQPIPFSKALELRQEVEERNHMREAGLFDDEEDEEVHDAAPLLNQTLGDETEDGNISKGVAPPRPAEDDQGDLAMDDEQDVSLK